MGAGHWDEVYATRPADQLSWFQRSADTSLRLIAAAASTDSAVVDVGAGRSPLVDALVDAGWSDLTVLDISGEALAAVRGRLHDRAHGVSFVRADVLTWEPSRRYDVWHDRAVLHFLVEPADRARYVATATRAVAAGGALVLGT
ncbi:MAG: class I SAM-dependent methyltransferase, partial [Mycobacteriales bacterium]